MFVYLNYFQHIYYNIFYKTCQLFNLCFNIILKIKKIFALTKLKVIG